MIAQRDERPVALGDYPPDHAGASGDLGDMRFAFGLVGVQQRLRRLAAQYRRQFPAQVGDVAHPSRHPLADPRRHGMCGVAGEEDPAHPPPVGDADVMAVDHRAQDLDVLGGDALIAQHPPDLLVVQECLFVLSCTSWVLPPVVTQRRRAVDGRPGRVGVEAQPVVGVPFPHHLGVDDDPPFGVGAPAVADPQLAAGG